MRFHYVERDSQQTGTDRLRPSGSQPRSTQGIEARSGRRRVRGLLPPEDFNSAVDLYERHALELSGFIHTEPLERGPEVFKPLADSSDERVKIVLTP